MPGMPAVGQQTSLGDVGSKAVNVLFFRMGDQPIEGHESGCTWLRGRGVWLVAVSTDEEFHVPLWVRLRIHFYELLGQAILDGRADRSVRQGEAAVNVTLAVSILVLA